MYITEDDHDMPGEFSPDSIAFRRRLAAIAIKERERDPDDWRDIRTADDCVFYLHEARMATARLNGLET